MMERSRVLVYMRLNKSYIVVLRKRVKEMPM